MPQLLRYDSQSQASDEELRKLVDFLHKQLQQYGDPKEHIRKAIEYSLGNNGSPGGFTIALQEGGELVGAVVINRTGMEGYIPENILVYIATHKARRGQGLGKTLMKEAITACEGSIALHVEPDNPAKKLYEALGFTNKYLEMRLTR